MRKPGVPAKLARSLLFLLVVSLVLLGLRLSPGIAPGGWVPIATLLTAIGMLAIALMKILRAP